MLRHVRVVTTVGLLAFALAATVFGMVRVVRDASSPAAAGPESIADGPAVVVFYLHGDARCDACVTMQTYSEAAVRKGFAEPLASGRLAFREINYHDPADAHYAEDFNIASPSLVIVRYEAGQRINHENLTEIWDLADDEAAFHAYVTEHVAAALEQR
jgi:hypothetical protein